MRTTASTAAPVRQSAFSVSQVLSKRFPPVDESAGHSLPDQQPEPAFRTQKQQDSAHLGQIKCKVPDSMVSVAKSVMQSSGTGCQDVVELLGMGPR